MTSIDELVGGPHSVAQPFLSRGRVAQAPASAAADMVVTLDGLGRDHGYEVPAGQWLSRDTLPADGDLCLVAFDEQGDAWVLVGTAPRAPWVSAADLAAATPIVTSLPGSPVDGQECRYLADATNGIVWHLKYRSGASGSYKWEYIGGPPMLATVETLQSLAAGTGFQDPATAGPSLTLPLAGDYDFDYGATLGDPGQNRCIAAPKLGAAAAVDADGVWSAGGPTTGNNDTSVHRRKRFLAQAATTVIKLQYRNAVSSVAATYEKRWLAITPVRVG